MEPFLIRAFTAQAFYDALSNPYCSSNEVARQDRAIYLCGYLTDLHAKTMVVEKNYIDGDFLEDFASYYVRCFKDYDRRCIRLHFFAHGIEEAAFHDLILAPKPELLKGLHDNYLGFVVVRPLPTAIVGRTVLKTYPSDGGRRHYTAVKNYHANLFGTAFNVNSLPFQEQDTVLAACATVALWSAFHKTSELFGTPSPRPAEITRVANGVVSNARAIPSHGLDIRQMAHAIRSVGLEPEFFGAKPDIPFVSMAYGYLRMGLPVILGVHIEGGGLHAVTLTGYSLKPAKVHQQEVASGEKCIPMVGLRIDEFYAHDDQVGPFSRLKVKASIKDYPVLFEGQWKDKSSGTILEIRPIFLLIPVYNKIRVTFLDISGWLERVSAVLSLFLPPGIESEWDLRMTTINELKKDIKGEQFESSELKWLLFAQSPRFIWRATLRCDTKKIMEFFADATDMQRSFPFYHHVWHDKGFQNRFQDYLVNPQVIGINKSMLEPRLYEFLTRGASSPPSTSPSI